MHTYIHTCVCVHAHMCKWACEHKLRWVRKPEACENLKTQVLRAEPTFYGREVGVATCYVICSGPK